jgi:hypothetical protein
MAWRLSGRLHELCSCKMLCPCWLGPEIEPDQGWCGGAVILDIQRGNSDGVDLGGVKAVFVGDWPGNFFGGNGTARLYVDEGAGPEQRRELEAIVMGKKGGMWEALGGVLTKWLPTQYVPITVQWGDETTATVGSVGQVRSRGLKDPTGRPTTVQGAAAMAAFQLESMEVAHTAGSRWSDPEMHQWDGSSGTRSTFSWSG